MFGGSGTGYGRRNNGPNGPSYSNSPTGGRKVSYDRHPRKMDSFGNFKKRSSSSSRSSGSSRNTRRRAGADPGCGLVIGGLMTILALTAKRWL